MEKIIQKDERFISSVRKIAIPVALQCMLQSSFSIIDQVMIGQLGSTSIAAVGLAGKFSWIFSIIVAAVGTVAGILIIQYLGAKDHEETKRSFSLNLLVAVLIAGLFMAVSIFAPSQILSCYVKNRKTIAEGAAYLRILSFSFLPMAASTLISVWLHCKEKAVIPFVASILAVACNTGLNYILILGKFGFEAIGSKGAGYATVASQMVNFLIMLLGMLFVNTISHQKAFGSPRLQKMKKGKYLAILFPVLISEYLWCLGENMYASVYGHIGTDSVAVIPTTKTLLSKIYVNIILTLLPLHTLNGTLLTAFGILILPVLVLSVIF